MKAKTCTGVIFALALASSSSNAAPVVIDFEGLPSMTYFVGNVVPLEAQLSDQLVGTFGVRFSSGNPYVSVVAMGLGHATSGVNGIAGSDGNGLNTGSFPIDISFFDPANTAVAAVTDFVSLRGDLWGAGTPVFLYAFDVFGNPIASDTQVDFGGETLAVSAPGIHSVRFIGNGSVGVDDLTFNEPLRPVPVPALGLVTAFMAGGVLRSRRRSK